MLVFSKFIVVLLCGTYLGIILQNLNKKNIFGTSMQKATTKVFTLKNVTMFKYCQQNYRNQVIQVGPCNNSSCKVPTTKQFVFYCSYMITKGNCFSIPFQKNKQNSIILIVILVFEFWWYTSDIES